MQGDINFMGDVLDLYGGKINGFKFQFRKFAGGFDKISCSLPLPVA